MGTGPEFALGARTAVEHSPESSELDLDLDVELQGRLGVAITA
jgi:hypothetical protein